MMTARTLIFVVVIFVVSIQARAGEYPPHYKDVPCPQTPHTSYPTSPRYFNEVIGVEGPGHYVSRCFYENGARMVAYWSDNHSRKTDLCNQPHWKERLSGSRYNLMEAVPSKEKRYWFTFKLSPERGLVVVKDVTSSGPADKGGIKINDEIIAIDGLPVGKFSQEEMQAFLSARDTVTLKVHDTKNFVYRDIRLAKEEIKGDGYRHFELYSPVHTSKVGYRYPNVEGRKQEDYSFWYGKAMEYLKTFEKQGVVCKDLDLSDKGPVAE